MIVQTAATPINPFKVFQPLSQEEKLQIRNAKFVGLPDIHVKVLSRIGLPEIHI